MCDEVLDVIIKKIKEKTGLNLEEYRCNTLRRRLKHRYISLQLKDEKEYLHYFLDNVDKEVNILKDLFLINTTAFFRVPLHFTYLFVMLNRCIKLEKKYIKVLDIGCSTGEETYSIAITLNELKLKNRDIEYHIDAIDVDNKALEKTKNPFYTKDSLLNAPLGIVEKYFSKEADDLYKLKTELFENRINFINSNILTDKNFIHGIFKYDVVFCENVVIYLKESARRKLFETIVKTMNKNGLLFLSESETIDIPEISKYFIKVAEHIKVFRYKGEE